MQRKCSFFLLQAVIGNFISQDYYENMSVIYISLYLFIRKSFTQDLELIMLLKKQRNVKGVASNVFQI